MHAPAPIASRTTLPTHLALAGCFLLLLAVLLPVAARAQAPAWAAAVSSSGQAGGSTAIATALDTSGNVFVAGAFTGTVAFGSTVLTSAGGSDVFVAKYVPTTAAWSWAVRGGGTGNDAAQGVAVSGSNVYVTGYIQNNTADGTLVRFSGTGPAPAPQLGASATVSSDLFVAKYVDHGAAATLGWTQVGGGMYGDIGLSIAVSGSNVYVNGEISNNTIDATQVRFGGTGTTPGTVRQLGASTNANARDLVVVKYVDHGTAATVGWTQVGGGISSDTGWGIAVSGRNVYVSGFISNNATDIAGVRFGGSGLTPGTAPVHGTSTRVSDDLLVAKYTDLGTSAALGWTQVGGGTGRDIGLAIAASGSNVYVTGSISNNDADANVVRFGGGGGVPGTVPAHGASPAISDDLVVAKYTDLGASAALGWTQIGGGTNSDQGRGIAVSGSSVYVTGYIQNNTADSALVRFGGGGAGTMPVRGTSPAISDDLVVAKYVDSGPSAALGWTQIGGGTGIDQGLGIALHGQNVLVGGGSSANANFGPFAIVSPGGTTVTVLARMVDSGLALAVGHYRPTAGLALYPNPAAGRAATLAGAEPSTAVHVLDALGRFVVRATTGVDGTATLVLPPGLAPGVYVVRTGARALQLVVE